MGEAEELREGATLAERSGGKRDLAARERLRDGARSPPATMPPGIHAPFLTGEALGLESLASLP